MTGPGGRDEALVIREDQGRAEVVLDEVDGRGNAGELDAAQGFVLPLGGADELAALGGRGRAADRVDPHPARWIIGKPLVPGPEVLLPRPFLQRRHGQLQGADPAGARGLPDAGLLDGLGKPAAGRGVDGAAAAQVLQQVREPAVL